MENESTLSDDELLELLTLTLTVSDRRKTWKNANGQVHRIYGPAVDVDNGVKLYYCNGELHRTDGPAVVYASGYKEYWINGERHRTDGPAVIWPEGDKEYWVNGKQVNTF